MSALTEEQRMLRDSLEAILAETSDPADVWRKLGELGMLGLALPDSVGGAGLGIAELVLFARTLGRSGQRVPYIAAEVLAAPLLGECATQSSFAELLDGMLNGNILATLAFGDAPPAATEVEGGYRLSGALLSVPAGAAADVIIVASELNDAPALFLLDVTAEGVRRTPHFPRDLDAGADLRLEFAALPGDALISAGAEAERLLLEARARAQLVTAAAMLGGMEELLAQTIEYLRTRKQFGQTLASFQVLQHAAVDMYVELETASAMLDFGLAKFTAPAAERSQALNAVKLKMNQAAKLVGESAVQLHGGIGMTEESLTGRLFARLTGQRFQHGDSLTCLNGLLDCPRSLALN